MNYPQLSLRLNEVVLLGSTLDLVQRDAMEYDVASKDGLLAAAWTAHYHGLDWLGLAAGKGQTLRDGLNFTIPYATGQISHAEFVNSLVTFDKINNRGGMFDPAQAQKLLTRAAALDSRYSQHANPALLSPFERALYYSISTAP